MSTFESIVRDANARVVEDGNVEQIEKYFSEKYVVHIGGSKHSGHAGVRRYTKAIHRAFSQLSVDVEILLASGRRISWQRSVHGTQTGAFQGFPASGRRFTWRDMVVSQIEDGRIVQEWVVSDLAEALLRSTKG